MSQNYHIPVLLKESVSALNIGKGGIYVDATLGGGGHSREILSGMGRNGRLVVFDRDADAIANAPVDKRVTVVHGDFRFIANYLKYNEIEGVDGILADLGVSSHQFDTGERGFSFRFDAPLDMRMNQLGAKSAKDIVNSYSKEDLKRILKLYGEVDNAGRVADAICRSREKQEITTTFELNSSLESLLPKGFEHKILAKIYQSFRVELNGEMKSLEGFLKGAYRSLKPTGRLVVITYHSLEDRMVKNFIRSGNIEGDIQKDIYGKSDSHWKSVTKKPIVPTEEEISINTRARSAKLRVAEKI